MGLEGVGAFPSFQCSKLSIFRGAFLMRLYRRFFILRDQIFLLLLLDNYIFKIKQQAKKIKNIKNIINIAIVIK